MRPTPPFERQEKESLLTFRKYPSLRCQINGAVKINRGGFLKILINGRVKIRKQGVGIF